MATPLVNPGGRLAGGIAIEVETVSEARDELTQTLSRFRSEGVLASPVIFGSHRKPEAVTVPFELFEMLLPAIEDLYLNELTRRRLESSQAVEMAADELLALVGVTAAQVAAVDVDAHVVRGAARTAQHG